MTTQNLLGWIGLLGGAEAMWRGHLGALPWLFYAGATVLMLALAFAAWRLRARRGWATTLAAIALLPGVWALAEAAGAFTPSAETPDPLLELWSKRPRERAILEGKLPIDENPLRLFGHAIPVDPRGWRRDAARPGAFRIVASGGGVTFGATQQADAPTWPSALEAAIGREFACATPIEVINAGVPGRGIQATLASFEPDLDALSPDLLLHMPDVEDLAAVVREVPDVTLPARKPVPERASQLLRRYELGRERRNSERRFGEAAGIDPADHDLRDSPLGRSYRALVLQARARGVDVVLLPIVLAVDVRSSETDLHRFEALEARARRFALARPLHQRLLRQVSATHRAQFVDATPELDGAGDTAFLHLATLSPEGRERLAENVLDGLRERLGRPPLGCVAKTP